MSTVSTRRPRSAQGRFKHFTRHVAARNARSIPRLVMQAWNRSGPARLAADGWSSSVVRANRWHHTLAARSRQCPASGHPDQTTGRASPPKIDRPRPLARRATGRSLGDDHRLGVSPIAARRRSWAEARRSILRTSPGASVRAASTHMSVMRISSSRLIGLMIWRDA
jgi:hypothetical protein